MSEGAGAAEWMAFLSPFSEASLNRFVTGQLGLGTGQDGAGSGVEIPGKRPASLISLKKNLRVWKSGASSQPAWLYLLGWEKLPWEGFYHGRWGGGDGIPVSQGTPALGTQTLPQGKATRGSLGRPAQHQTPPSVCFLRRHAIHFRAGFNSAAEEKLLFASFCPFTGWGG